MIKPIKRLLKVDLTAEVTNKTQKVLPNGTKVYFATIKREHPIVPGK